MRPAASGRRLRRVATGTIALNGRPDRASRRRRTVEMRRLIRCTARFSTSTAPHSTVSDPRCRQHRARRPSTVPSNNCWPRCGLPWHERQRCEANPLGNSLPSPVARRDSSHPSEQMSGSAAATRFGAHGAICRLAFDRLAALRGLYGLTKQVRSMADRAKNAGGIREARARRATKVLWNRGRDDSQAGSMGHRRSVVAWRLTDVGAP